LAFLALWILAVVLVLTFFVQTKWLGTRSSCIRLSRSAWRIVYEIEHLHWGKQLFILSGCIAPVVFLFQQDIFRQGS
jgi:hypothetical protein